MPPLKLERQMPAKTKQGRRSFWLQLQFRMALQNMQRRPVRTLLLTMAVALAVGAVFASYTVACGLADSIEKGFARMGADLVVVPEKTMVNITSALLTVQPTEESMDRQILQDILQLSGVKQATAQTIYRVPVMAGMPQHQANLIAFDPRTDFTVMPWLVNRRAQAMKTGELISGGRRSESVDQEIQPCNTPATIYGKLGVSGVGPFDDSLFASYETVSSLLSSSTAHPQCQPKFSPERISAVLVKLEVGATAEQLRFAISRLPKVKVIQGAVIVTATRQSTTALLNALTGLAAVILVSFLILIALLFAAIIAERRREIGVLQAIGARQSDIAGMLITEAAVTTAIGGLTGILFGSLLLVAFDNSLVYYLKTLHMDFTWPSLQFIALTALGMFTLATLVGLVAAAFPAWRITQKDPYVLIQGEDVRC